jgi:TetR/AcrR family transcriptional repressor of nem operon
MLRERGLEAASIADVMHEAGMTHGGFYKHFKSKNDLVRAAVRFAFDEIIERFDRREATGGRDDALAAYVEEYLSLAHIAHSGAGCPVAALGADAGRNSIWLSAEFIDGAEKLIQRIGQAGEAASEGAEHHARAAAIRTLTQLVGAVVVARAVGPGRLRDELLAACADLRLSK